MQKFTKIFLGILTLIAITIIGFKTNTVFASSNRISTEVVTGDTVIDGKYEFIADWIDGKTTLSTFGTTWERFDKRGYEGSPNAYRIFLRQGVNDRLKGKIGVVYHNVGMYKGNCIDLKITLTDWQIPSGVASISYDDGMIGHTQKGALFVKQKWEFINASTGQPVKLDGYMTINDLDWKQGVTFTRDTVSKIKKFYVTKDTVVSFRDEYDGSVTASDEHLVITSPTNKRSQFTFVFENTSYIEFDWNLKNRSDNIRGNDSAWGGDFFSFTGKKIAKSSPAQPSKFIKGKNLNDLKTDTTLNSLSDNITYEIYHKVNDELKEFYYKSYEIRDTIPKGLTVISSNIFDYEGNNIGYLFDNVSNGNNICFRAKYLTLTSQNFYNKDYRIEVITKPVSKSSLDSLLDGNVITFKNKATVIVDGKSKESPEVITKLYRRKITIKHIDEKTGKILKQTVEYKYDGESYEYKPSTDLLDDNGNTYKSSISHKGIVQGSDIELEIPYHMPTLQIDVDKIQIDTSKAEKDGGLPTILTFSKSAEYEDELGKIVFKVKVTDVDKHKVVYDENVKLEDYKKEKPISLPTDYLNKGQKVNYAIDILLVDNPDKNKFITSTKNVLTHGFTASEKVLKNSDLKGNKINYEGVVRTVKERSISDVKEFVERISYNFIPEVRSKTGYGFSLDLSPVYTNEIGRKADMKMFAFADNDLVDSFINEEYLTVGTKTRIGMDLTKNDSITESGELVQNFVFQFPHMNVERKTGNLFTNAQKNNKNSKIRYDLVDGGRKLYIPIWCDLGNYEVAVKSNTFGSNLVSLNMTKELDVYAYMYATISSKTSKEDELLLEPVYPESANPKGWNEDELNWLRE